VWIWDAATGNEVMMLKGQSDWVTSVVLSPNGAQIVSGSDDETVRIWDAATGNEVMKLEGHSHWVQSVPFSPNGAQIVSGSGDKTVQIWDAATGNAVMELEGHSDDVTSVAFSPNGAQILSDAGDKTVRISDATTGKIWASTAELSGSNVSAPASDAMPIWDRLTSQQPSRLWIAQMDGWVVVHGYPDIRLFWYPPELHHTLLVSPCVQIISTSGQTYLKFDPHSLGPSWWLITSPPG
jgi:WD40 repeat protein